MKRYIQGLAVFLVSGLVLGFVGFPLQTAFGAVGLAATELLTLGMALAATVICRLPLREVCPSGKVGPRQVGGFFLLYIGGQNLATLLTWLTTLVTPEVSGRLEEVEQLTRMPLWVAIPVVAILPAVCEEFLFRGVLRRLFADLPPMATALVVGLLFGAFHLDVYRLVPTAVLGVAITYLCVKTDNFYLAVGYHLLNNLLAVLSSHFEGAVPSVAVGGPIGWLVIGICCFLLAGRILTKEQ